jgi:hypothetical protein
LLCCTLKKELRSHLSMTNTPKPADWKSGRVTVREFFRYAYHQRCGMCKVPEMPLDAWLAKRRRKYCVLFHEIPNHEQSSFTECFHCMPYRAVYHHARAPNLAQ